MSDGGRGAAPSGPPPPPGDPRRPPLPDGLGLCLDRGARRFAGGSVVAGGRPGRLLILSAAGVGALDRLLAGERDGPVPVRRLARRLVDAGIAHPTPPAGTGTPTGPGPDVTVVVPVKDRPASLDRCLGALGRAVPVVVVDDGSRDPAAVAAVCAAHGARRVRREVNGGPAAARDTALTGVASTLVAFVDSDCVVPAGWLDRLLWHFADPTVAAVAPRIRPLDGPGHGGARARYASARSALDLGPEPSPVGADRAVRYVPTAALLVRVAALAHPAFDPELRVGEDVDLVWRLTGRGWSVRYDPSVEVGHEEPGSWPALVRRRFRYGTSAGPLARRHGTRVAALEVRPGPGLAAAAVLAGRPAVGGLVAGVGAARLVRRTRGTGVPPTVAARWALAAAGGALVGAAHWSTMVAWPVAAAVVARGRTSRSRALRLALLVGSPALVEWWRRRPPLDPLRWTLASVVDDAGYGAGVWVGCLRSRTLVPLLPARGAPEASGRAG